jgi:hypothetical protein
MICLPLILILADNHSVNKMKQKLFNDLLLFSLFGIALGFFGILYEGIVYGPKFLDVSMERMLFWKSFTSIISPIPYYIPIYPLATLLLVFLSFRTPKEKPELKKRLQAASLFQIASLVLTFYILTQINFKGSFGNLEKYAMQIPHKVLLFNILSVLRMGLAAIALTYTFRAFIAVTR